MSIDAHIEQLRSRYPQAHAVKGDHGEHLVLVPGFRLPMGFSADICTLLFVAPAGFPAGALPEAFWIDIPGLRVRGRWPRYSNTVNPIPGFPSWKELTFFKWHLQAWNPSQDGLLTIVNAIRRLLPTLTQDTRP